jgi:hypothetical protein
MRRTREGRLRCELAHWHHLTRSRGRLGHLQLYGLAGARYFGIADKKFWDYLELLIVPAALAFGVYWLNRTQEERQQEADRFQQQLQLEHNQMQQNRGLEVATQQAQDAALRAYLALLTASALVRWHPRGSGEEYAGRGCNRRRST